MPLPSWMGRARHGDSVHEAAQSFSPATSKANAPGWRLLDEEYSCVWPADLTPDPAAVAFLKSFYPDAIVMCVRERWLPPNSHEETLAVHWAVGRYVWNPHKPLIPFHCAMPADADGPAPNHIDMVWEDPVWCDQGGPGPYEPFDMALAHKARRAYTEGADDEAIKAFIRRQREEQEARVARMKADLAERRRHLEKSLLPRLAAMTPYDWQRYHAKNWKRFQKKPFVTVQGANS